VHSRAKKVMTAKANPRGVVFGTPVPTGDYEADGLKKKTKGH
jgi:hypothetical protein